jgi:polyhydroxyalkanoate synthesis regulator phasin
MLESLERLILLQIGVAAVTRERVQEVVNRLIEQGRMEREEGRAVVEDILSRARERSSGTRGLVDASVQQGLRGVGIPNREAYEDLLFRIEQLEHRVRLLEGQPARTTPGHTAAVTPEAPEDTTPPVPPGGQPMTPPISAPSTGIDVGPQSPRDEPDDITPGLTPRP